MVLKDMWPCFGTCAARRGNLQHAELMHCFSVTWLYTGRVGLSMVANLWWQSTKSTSIS